MQTLKFAIAYLARLDNKLNLLRSCTSWKGLTKSSHTIWYQTIYTHSYVRMLGSSLDDPCGIVLVFLKSNSKLRLASPWAFYCQAIRIFYHLHYAHEARIISRAAAFRRPSPPLHCVGCLEHLKPPSSSISPSSRHLFYFLWFRVVCKTIWGHHEMCLTFCLSPHTHTPVTHCRQVLCFYVFIFCLCFFLWSLPKMETKAKSKAQSREPKAES